MVRLVDIELAFAMILLAFAVPSPYTYVIFLLAWEEITVISDLICADSCSFFLVLPCWV